MSNFDALIEEVAVGLNINDRITASGCFDECNVFVGYSYSGNPQIKFGSIVAILTESELRALIAHELAHISAGHTSRMACRIVHAARRWRRSPLRTFLMSLLVALVQTRRYFVGKREEFQADDIACGYLPCTSASLARVLVKLESFECAAREIWRHGTAGGMLSDSSASGSLDATQIRTLSSIEIIKAISHSFRTSRRSFQLCSQTARLLDRANLTYPSTTERLERLGFNWEAAETSCTFELEELIDFDAFRNWCGESGWEIAPDEKTKALSKGQAFGWVRNSQHSLMD